MPFDMSDNCQLCGANPHEECRFPNMGNHQAINCKMNRVALDSRRDDMKTHSRLEHEEEDHPDAMIFIRGEDNISKADSAMTSSDASKPVYSFSEERRKREEEKEKNDPSSLKTSNDVFETIWSFMKGRTLRSKRAAKDNKERAEVKRMKRSPVAMDPNQQRRLMRELGLPSAYEGDEFQTE
tara:strand:+ start:471 stop:1016 length:546 start_codon:yes stop_codon:yes gene_type:complete